MADRELLVLPVLSVVVSAAALVVLGWVVTTLVAPPSPAVGELIGEADAGEPRFGFIAVFIGVATVAFISTFFNTALVSAALERMRGGDPTIRTALSGAVARIGNVFSWSLVVAVFVILLKAVEDRLGWVARLTLGLAWRVVTFLVLPVIVVEGVSPASAIRRSSQLLRQTWGQNLIANISLDGMVLLAVLPVAAFPLCSIALLNTTGLPLAVFYLFLGLMGAWLIGSLVVVSALTGIFKAALYLYAVEGKVPEVYGNAHLFTRAFSPGRQKRKSEDDAYRQIYWDPELYGDLDDDTRR